MTRLSDLVPDLDDPEAVARSLFEASPFRHPTPPEKLAEIRDRLQLAGEYRVYETAIRVDPNKGWQVIHGDRVVEAEDMDQAHRLLLHYRERPCTSCGRKGCPHDFSRRKTFLVDPLPGGPLP